MSEPLEALRAAMLKERRVADRYWLPYHSMGHEPAICSLCIARGATDAALTAASRPPTTEAP